MSSNTYHQVLSHSSLTRAWTYLYKKTKPLSRNTVGVDGISVNDYQVDAKGNLIRLSQAIKAGSFCFSPLKPYLIPKPNGKWRLISVPTVRDRIVQGALNDYLSDKYHSELANSVSFGFVKGRGVQLAARIACELRAKHPWVYKTDITSFFDSIPRESLRSAIKKAVKERSLHQILFSALDSEVEVGGKSTNANIAKLGIKSGQGVRQGMPLSPFFSNLLLLPFDRKIHSIGATAIRYADDLIFLCDSKAECERVGQFCQEELNKLGLSVPPLGPNSKSAIYSPEEPAEFLGLAVCRTEEGYELRLSADQLQKLKQEILGHGNIKQLVSRKITLATLGQALKAKRDGYLAAYAVCSNIEAVSLELMKAEQRALRNVYGQGLGIKLSAIGATARAFLGLSK